MIKRILEDIRKKGNYSFEKIIEQKSLSDDDFFELLGDRDFIDDNFELEMYNKALKLHGEVKYEDCYCFVPIIPVGGKKIENLQKGKTFTYIEVIVYLMGWLE